MAYTVDPVAIGIKRIIRRKGFKQNVIAVRSGFTEQQFSDMMNDRKIIKAIDLIPISRELGVGVAEIYNAGIEPNDAGIERDSA